ncbi:hypothetical protein A0H81_06445 [Grifola frondosa]|uniref:Uncharacterized protein n=1 Tax=Grifola frondosa TaxID=5627 RepID=A0A1C7MD00_GRIFR|nr:hypothetical protein A0H81_06445 [Grifola frondosa]
MWCSPGADEVAQSDLPEPARLAFHTRASRASSTVRRGEANACVLEKSESGRDPWTADGVCSTPGVPSASMRATHAWSINLDVRHARHGMRVAHLRSTVAYVCVLPGFRDRDSRAHLFAPSHMPTQRPRKTPPSPPLV